ncbi:hypothetical protein ABZ502_17110 [Streptomyces abikoensis]|uniref:hypothetical protein n=1 Tax=Streptomyces abikoensis TaxID=97398 RepID=UPI003407029F
MPTAPRPGAHRKIVLTSPNPVRQVDQDAVSAFAELLFDPSRLKPLILISPDTRQRAPLIDPLVLHESVGEHAEVAVLTDIAACYALHDLLPDLGVWGGAIRIYRPDAREDDSTYHHPLVLPFSGHSDEALAEIRDQLHRLGVTYTTSTPTGTPSVPAALMDVVTGSAARALEAEIARLKATLTDRDQVVSDLRRETQRLGKPLKAAEARATTDVPVVFTDPERQFRHEVEQCWLRMMPETDRAAYPLVTYRLGPSWLTSLETAELVDRNKVVEVTVDVLTGRASAVPGRQVQRMPVREERGAPQLIRRRDQAVAMRCFLKSHTAAAPRLMWWRLPDHSIELGRVAVHDDTQLR